MQGDHFGRHWFRHALPVFLVLLLTVRAGSVTAAGTPAGIHAQLTQLLASGPARHLGQGRHGFTAEQVNGGLQRVYGERGFRPLWLTEGKPNRRAETLRQFLDASAAAGLEPDDYRVRELARLWGRDDAASRAQLEVLLTLGYVGYVADMSEGRVDARILEQQGFADARDSKADLPAMIRQGLAAPDLGGFLQSREPQHPYYQKLKLCLQRYRAVARRGGWAPVPAGPVLKMGSTDPRVPLLRRRLAATGDLGESNHPSNRFDASLDEAVRRFQMRHYLPQEGKIDRATLAAMNVPVAKRIRQIIINLERWRWVSRDLSGKQIFVNIAGFNLIGMRDGRIELIMPVVVGEPYHQTPVFNERMTYIDFNPQWTVPPSIAAEEYLPALKKNPAVLRDKHIRIFQGFEADAPELDPERIDWTPVTPTEMARYVLRQDPGPWNALGTVKFMLPNRYNVYLHDTAQPRYFAERQRMFSHGCIRLSRPQELAAWVLADGRTGWDLGRVKAAVASGKTTTVRLEKPMPVHILYRTAVTGKDEILRFRKDVYGRDAVLERALFRS